MQGTVHHIIAFGAILSSNILHHSNVSAFDDDFCGVVVTAKDRAKVRAGRGWCESGGVVRGPRQEDGSPLAPFGTIMTVCNLTPVAHRNITSRLTYSNPSLVGLNSAGLSSARSGVWPWMVDATR